MLRWKRECEGILREGARWVRPVREHGGGDGIGQGEPQAVMHSGWKSQPAQQGHPCPVNQSLGCLGRPGPQLYCCGSSGRPAAEGCQLPTPVQLRVVVHCLQGRAGALRVWCVGEVLGVFLSLHLWLWDRLCLGSSRRISTGRFRVLGH